MYEFLDRPVSTLDPGGRFLVWSMRSWVKAMGERACSVNAIAPVFGRWNVIAGLQPFLRVMTLLNRHGLETFQFCAPQCNHVSEHEAMLLRLICASREARPQALRDTLAMLIEEEGIGDIFVALSDLSQALAKSGMTPRGGGWLPQQVPPAATRGDARE